MSQIKLTIGAVPATPATGEVSVYPKSDKRLYVKDDTGAESSFSPATTTDALTEGATNKYFTDERAQDAIAAALTDTATIDITYNDVANTITADLKSVSVDDSHIKSSAAITLSKLAALTASRALVSSGSGVVDVSTVTAVELGYLAGATSTLQTQIAAKADPADVTAAQAFSIQRVNHTGTQLAATISDFSTAADARVALKIEDLLVDGVTTKAPSQNVVYDAIYSSPTKVAANDVIVSGATYTILTPDKTLYVTQPALCVITLPTPTVRRKIVIKDMSGTRSVVGQEIRMARNGSESIDGIAFRRNLQSNYGCWTFESDGANWFITG